MSKGRKLWKPYRVQDGSGRSRIEAVIDDADSDELKVEWAGDGLRIDTTGCKWIVISMSEIGRMKRLFYRMEKMMLEEQEDMNQDDY